MSKKKSDEEILNDLTFSILYDKYKNIALERFEWEGLPNGVEQRFIEKYLFENGKGLFFEDEILGFFTLPCTPSNFVNVYGEPTEFYANGIGYHQKYTIDNSVLIKNNNLSSPTKDFLMLYVSKIAEIERTLDVNVMQQKTPYIIKTTEKGLLTMKNIIRDINSNKMAIYTDKSFNIGDIDVLETQAPDLTESLTKYKHELEGIILTYLGLNNGNTDKKERLVVDEINSNNELIYSNIEYMLATRKRACEEINKMFGLNVNVKIKEVKVNGTIHTNNKTDCGKQY